MSKFLKQILAFSLLAAAVTFGLHLNAQSSLKDLKQLQATGSDIMPVGVVLPYNGAAAPTGWLLAQGQCVSQTTYAALYSITGSLPYNTGCGGGLFKVPDYRGRYLRGAGAPGDGNGGDTVALGTFATDKTKANGLTASFGSGSAASAGSHTHAVYQNSGNNVVGGTAIRVAGSDSGPQVRIDQSVDASGTHTHTVTGTVTMGTGDSETRPKSYGVNYIIKY